MNKEAIKKKYAQEREKRLRPNGDEQYLRMHGTQLADPYTPFKERPPLEDHVTVTFIGGGYAGLVTGARLSELGISDYRVVEKGGDFGGTWYWNRYPGAMCDTASMIYMPLLEETHYMPKE
ncbi:MAG: NAD(P)-binding protein, partial [Halioglobus sp.]